VRRRIPIYKRVEGIYVKVGEASEEDFSWLVDEDNMEIVSVYIDEQEEDSSIEEERKVYEYSAEP